MSLALFSLLPQLFRTGQLIIRVIEDRKVSPEEMAQIVAEFRTLVMSIPELKGFLAIFDVLVKVAAVVLPTFLGDKGKIIAMGLQPEEVEQAIVVADLFRKIVDEQAAVGKAAADIVTPDDVEDMT